MPRVALYVCLGMTLLAQGDVAGAKSIMNKSDQIAGHNTVAPSFRARHAAYRVMFCLRLNDVAGAAEWGNRLAEYSKDLAMEFQQVTSRLLIALGEIEKAREQLTEVYRRVTNSNARGLAIQIRVYQALAASDPAEAQSFFEEALREGEGRGYIRTFVDEGQLVAPMLRKAISQGVTPEYAAKLLNIIQEEERLRRSGDKTGHATAPGGPLSERELEILGLLEKGLSNKQIAERLVITLATAKTHVHNISQKLNAKTRTEALARAREMKLI